MNNDALRLRNMRFFGYHGMLAEENTLGQEFQVDVELNLSLKSAAEADDPALTVDYVRVYEEVKRVVEGQRYKLLETVAEQICQELGRVFGPLRVTVRVRKPHPPVDARFDGVEIEIVRAVG